MKFWPWLLLTLFFCVAGLPLLPLVVQSFAQLPEFRRWEEAARFAVLAQNTLLLLAGTLILALPTGTFLALLLFRTDLPSRGLFLFLLGMTIFIPLSVFVSSWQAALGPGSWLPFPLWQPRAGQPWTEGLLPAIWVHSQAAVPWVVLIVGSGLLWSGRELEEEALLAASSWQVVWSVTLPGCRPALLLASLWIVIQVAGEITVTDMFLVRTVAEETYLIFTQAGEEALLQSVHLSLPLTLILWLVLAQISMRLGAVHTPIRGILKPPLQFRLGKWRWPALGLVNLLLFILAGVPLISLVWRAGRHGTPLNWSWLFLEEGLVRTFLLEGRIIYQSLLWGLIVALLTTGLAFIICLSLFRKFRGRFLLLIGYSVILAAMLAFPGPIIGLGLKRLILSLVIHFPDSWLADVLYYGPSPVPLIWAQAIRTLPFAVVIVWIGLRVFPWQLSAAAKLDGSGSWKRLWHIYFPLSLIPLVCAVTGVLALALSEISASKLATTPGIDTFTLLVFDRMHYGVAREVASLCLVLLFLLAFAAVEIGTRGRVLGFTPWHR